MKWILLLVGVLGFIIFFTTVKIKIQYKRAKENDHIHIEAGIWFGVITFKFDIPMLQIQSLFHGVKVEEKVAPAPAKAPKAQKAKFRFTIRDFFRYLHRLYKLRIHVHDFNQIAKKTLKKIRCEQIEWYTRIGVGDAAATGVVTGVVWGVKSTLVGVLSHYLTLRTVPRMNVVPAYRGEDLDTRFSCILRFRIGHAIIAGTRILFKLRKGREGLWQNTPFRV